MGPTEAIINHAHLRHNLSLIRRAYPDKAVMAVVKADAYGHGIVPCAKTLLQAGAEWLGVAFPEEGALLREAGIEAPILVFGAQLSPLLSLHLKNDLHITITAPRQIDELEKEAARLRTRAKVFLKYDSGMNRVGMYDDTFYDTMNAALGSKAIDVAGVYSHLSSADEDDRAYTLLQLSRFKAMREKLGKAAAGLCFSLANSAGIMRYPETAFDCIRPGVMLYGNPPAPAFRPDPDKWPLRQVMTWRSAVALVKNVAADEPLSYNRRFHTGRPSKIAIVPVGYGDGYSRRWTNNGKVLINGAFYPVVGTVCMDQILVDVTEAQSLKQGAEVIIFGSQGDASFSIAQYAGELQTIPYEVTCDVSPRVPRSHVKINKGEK